MKKQGSEVHAYSLFRRHGAPVKDSTPKEAEPEPNVDTNGGGGPSGK